MDFPPFPGFRDEAFAFFRALAQNNRRDWFKPRKETYEDEVVWPLRCLLVDVGQTLSRRGIPLRADPKRAIFRLYRDTRFSKNKAPYKTHAGAVFTRTGEKKALGGVYIHIEPGAAFLAAGFWRPDAKWLKAWRGRMTADPDAFLALVAGLTKGGLTPQSGEALKRMPRGFEAYADHDIAPYLKWKSFTVSQKVEDDALRTPAFTDAVVAFAEGVLPLLAYGWAVEEDTRAPSPPR